MENVTLCRFGTHLPILEDDEIPSKKPIAIEKQVVTDSNGRRRFHGAFTGGFSAGFWNTVGSLEGWKPKSFKSSRLEKASVIKQRPTDFMDEEDLGEFGIAPQRIQTTEEFTQQHNKGPTEKIRNRKLQQTNNDIKSYIPVLQRLVQPSKENVAVRILKKMGWKIGQGIGVRQTRKQKKSTSERNARESYVLKKYICEMERSSSPQKTEDNTFESDCSDISDEVAFAPHDVEPMNFSIKDNLFGIGYSGLDRNPALEPHQINLFGQFELVGKDSKNLSIRGQAFGVGALEEEDEDIYARDDMTKYDFCLDDHKKCKLKIRKQERTLFDGFQSAKQDKHFKQSFTVNLRAYYKPRNWAVRRSRFEPLEKQMIDLNKPQQCKIKGLGRHDLIPEVRARILGESCGNNKKLNIEESYKDNYATTKSYLGLINEKYKAYESEADKVSNVITSKFDSFTKGSVSDIDVDPIAKTKYKNIQNETEEISKNFSKNVGIKFLSEANAKCEEERKKEFIKNKRIIIQRTKVMWKPASQLCIRFNVTEPYGGSVIDDKPKRKVRFSVFDYIEKSINGNNKFMPPIIIPTISEKSELIVQLNPTMEQDTNRITSNKLSTKHLLKKELNSKKNNEVFYNKEITNNIALNQKSHNQPKQAMKVQKSQSELEKRCEQMRNKHPSEKKDLFKAIFEDYSNDKIDKANEKLNAEIEEIQQNATKDIFAALKRPAMDMNILRNTSPPRGIFTSMFSGSASNLTSNIKEKSKKMVDDCNIKLTTPKERILFKSNVRCKYESDVNMYGPKIPISLTDAKSVEKFTDHEFYDIDKKTVELSKNNEYSGKIVEEWIEKTNVMTCGSKKKRKKEKEKDEKTNKPKCKKHRKEKQ